MKKLFKRFKEGGDRGAALVLIGSTMLLLMGMAAFGTDLAWFYLNSSRIQRAADAAALGGVVWLPGDEATSFASAHSIAIQNGYNDASAETVVNPERVSGELNQLRVTISDTVPTFFLKVFGFADQTITEVGTAEYIPPLKLGSPANKFGNDPGCYGSNPNCAGNFWANIHGTRTDTRMGDAYSSYCENGDGSNNSCDQNPMYRNTGYLYGLMPGGSSVTLQTLDMAFHNESGGVSNGDQHRTGDHNNFCGGGGCVGQTVTVNVYRPDPTPLDISDNTLACSETYAPQPQVDPDDDPPFTPGGNWTWDNVCGGSINTSSSPDGIWVVQIVANSNGGRTTDDANLGTSGEDFSGLNRYSIRTNTGNIFALGDFSIFNNASGSTTAFHLAEVPGYYAGKTFVVEMYDTGESAANGTLQPVDPSGSVFDGGECRIYSRNITDTNWTLQNTLAAGNTCQEVVTPGEYNGRWLKFEMDIPATYSCTNCWWKMNYAYTSGVNDTTTWRAYMIGNPIHLVP